MNIAMPNLPSVPKSRRKLRWQAILLVLVILFLLLAILVSAYSAAASVTGVELNASTWQARRFAFFRDPFTGTQLTAIQHDTANQFSLETSISPLITGGAALPSQARWDLVNIIQGGSYSEGDARVLLRYVTAENLQGENYWSVWTTANPKLAAIFWPAVRDTVHLQCYERLPDVFDAPRVYQSESELQTALAPIMVATAVEAARRYAEKGDRSAARRAAQAGLAYEDSSTLQQWIDAQPQNNLSR